MAHYRMSERFPSAVITSGGNEKKIYNGGFIYLNDGENFEIRFFNPTQFKLGVEIIFNGYKKGDGYLVLNPGQDVTLDRFLDEQRKMVFETYTIDGNNQAAVEAAANNGLIQFNFYRESYFRYGSNTGYGTSGYSGNSGTRGFAGTGGGFAGTGGLPRFKSSNTNSRTYSDNNITYFDADFEQGTTSYTSSFTTTIDYAPDTMYRTSTSNSNPVETGRVEAGDVSNQTLENVSVQFETSPMHRISYKLLPYSAKPMEVTEIRQYCPNCGYRIRNNSWKYCPKCSQKIE